MNTVDVHLTRGYFAIVDEADAERVLAYKWHARPDGQTVYAGRNVRLPDGRRATQLLHGYLTGYARTDHINGDGLDNRRNNLRKSTAVENGWNRRPNRGSHLGLKGVSWHGRTGKWQAQIRVGDGRRLYLGLYATAEEAGLAYDAAARKVHGEFARLNFPSPAEHAA